MKISPTRSVRGLVLFVACAFLACSFSVRAGSVVPLSVTLDMPNQITTAPSSGVNTVVFTGTVVVDPNWKMQGAFFDAAYNVSKTNFLTGLFSSAFQAFVLGMNTGTFTGAIFSINVPTGTPFDNYAFAFAGGPSLLKLQAAGPSATTYAVNTPFSVQVTRLAAVPDGGSTLMLLSLAGCALATAQQVSRRSLARG